MTANRDLFSFETETILLVLKMCQIKVQIGCYIWNIQIFTNNNFVTIKDQGNNNYSTASFFTEMTSICWPFGLFHSTTTKSFGHTCMGVKTMDDLSLQRMQSAVWKKSFQIHAYWSRLSVQLENSTDRSNWLEPSDLTVKVASAFYALEGTRKVN